MLKYQLLTLSWIYLVIFKSSSRRNSSEFPLFLSSFLQGGRFWSTLLLHKICGIFYCAQSLSNQICCDRIKRVESCPRIGCCYRATGSLWAAICIQSLTTTRTPQTPPFWSFSVAMIWREKLRESRREARCEMRRTVEKEKQCLQNTKKKWKRFFFMFRDRKHLREHV